MAQGSRVWERSAARLWAALALELAVIGAALSLLVSSLVAAFDLPRQPVTMAGLLTVVVVHLLAALNARTIRQTVHYAMALVAILIATAIAVRLVL